MACLIPLVEKMYLLRQMLVKTARTKARIIFHHALNVAALVDSILHCVNIKLHESNCNASGDLINDNKMHNVSVGTTRTLGKAKPTI